MAGPGDRRDPDSEGLSSLAEGYRKASPYIAASTSLVSAVALFTLGGVWLDRKVGNVKVPCFTFAFRGPS